MLFIYLISNTQPNSKMHLIATKRRSTRKDGCFLLSIIKPENKVKSGPHNNWKQKKKQEPV